MSDPDPGNSSCSLPFEELVSSATDDDPEPLEGVFRRRRSPDSPSVALNLDRSIELFSRRFSGRWVRVLDDTGPGIFSDVFGFVAIVPVAIYELVERNSCVKITLSHSTEMKQGMAMELMALAELLVVERSEVMFTTGWRSNQRLVNSAKPQNEP